MPPLFASAFEGFVVEDFDIYRHDRWSNRLHNLDRMRNKDRVRALAEAMQARVKQDGLVVETSAPTPSVWNNQQVRDQWAYLVRSPEARKTLEPVIARHLDLETRIKDAAEHLRHVLLFVRIDAEGVEAGLRLPQHANVDIANLLGRARADGAAIEAALADLPESLTLDGHPPTADRLLALARRLERDEAEWLVLGRRADPEAAMALGTELKETVADVAEAVLPLFRLIAWRPENDHVGVADELQQIAADREEKAAELAQSARDAQAARDHRADEARKKLEAEIANRKAWAAATRRRPREEAPPPPKRRTAPDPDAPPKKSAAPAKPARPATEKKPARPTTEKKPARPATEKKPARPAPRPKRAARPAPAAAQLEIGATVQLTRGLLAGKSGEITARDKKDYYKVKVGGLEVSVHARDLSSGG